ncbi:hypothetical protein QKG26_gp086 [Chelonid alphaherpesvirus 5]|uniref:C2H2-type domain-containing protein n=1 Tax=Chelonid alphaherpesvirus 5 TaxID=702736 RepID=V5NYT0_9ALPH|nr:hypothetical protein QKG26_gp086 [Chelonid alphaherpesvirus 5]AHA93373.1 hypothetical protein [Chelonid alphaherpesvirus 5]
MARKSRSADAATLPPSLAKEFPTLDRGMTLKITKDGLIYYAFNRLVLPKNFGYVTAADDFHVCEDCGKRVKSETYMKNHVREHLGLYRMRCIFCGDGYAQIHELKKHVTVCRALTTERAGWLARVLVAANTVSPRFAKVLTNRLLSRKTKAEERRIGPDGLFEPTEADEREEPLNPVPCPSPPEIGDSCAEEISPAAETQQAVSVLLQIMEGEADVA